MFSVFRFGFVVFGDKASMEAALKDMQGSDLNGRSLVLDYSGSKAKGGNRGGGRGGFQQRGGRGGGFQQRGGRGGGGGNRPDGETKVLFVKNLSFDTDENSLQAAFNKSSSARIARFPDTEKPKG